MGIGEEAVGRDAAEQESGGAVGGVERRAQAVGGGNNARRADHVPDAPIGDLNAAIAAAAITEGEFAPPSQWTLASSVLRFWKLLLA